MCGCQEPQYIITNKHQGVVNKNASMCAVHMLSVKLCAPLCFEIALYHPMPTPKLVASYLAKNLLATHSTGSIGYYLCLFMQTQFQLGSYIHACTNETHSLANLAIRFNPYFGRHNYRQHKL